MPELIPDEQSPSPPRARILVVDDEADIRESLEDLLGVEGYAVDIGANAREGLRKVDARSPRAKAVLQDIPWAVADIHGEPGLGDLLPLAVQEGYRSFLDVPMRGRERVLGVLSAYYTEERRFTPTEIEMLRSFADQAAVALETAQLLRSQERRIAELGTLEEVGRVIGSTLDLDEVLARIHQQISNLMDTTSFYIALYDAERDEVSFPVVFEKGQRVRWNTRKGGRGLTELVLGTGQPLLLRGNVAEAIRARGAQVIGEEARSWLGVPIQLGEQTIGVITVQSYTDDEAFDEWHQRILQAIARQAAAVVQNARTVAEIRRLNEDLQQNLSTQKQLLETIRELSTPVIPLLKEIILLPLVGHIDSDRADFILGQVLSGVETHRSRVVIVDITGVPVVDTMVAQSLVQAAQATRLLGAEPVLVGITPEVAQTMVGLGVELGTLVTRADLQSGLEYAVEQLRRRK